MEGTASHIAVNTGPSTVEIVIGILALILALAAVAVAVIQVQQVRTTRVRQTDIESQNSTELSTPTSARGSPPQAPAVSPVVTISRRFVTI